MSTSPLRNSDPVFGTMQEVATLREEVRKMRSDKWSEMWLGKRTQLEYVSTNFPKTSDIVLADIPGLSVDVIAGKRYFFRAFLMVVGNAAGGHKFDFGGTATISSTRLVYEWRADGTPGSIPFANRQVTMGFAIGYTGMTSGIVHIEGGCVINAGGTITLRFAQNASNGNPSTVLAFSYMEFKRK